MTPNPCVASPANSLADIAGLIRDRDCGTVPIVDEGYIVGIVTDRDLRFAGSAWAGQRHQSRKCITASCLRHYSEDDLCDVEQVMVDNQVRRLPVIDRQDLALESPCKASRQKLYPTEIAASRTERSRSSLSYLAADVAQFQSKRQRQG